MGVVIQPGDAGALGAVGSGILLGRKLDQLFFAGIRPGNSAENGAGQFRTPHHRSLGSSRARSGRSGRGTLTTGDYGILGGEHAAAIERKSVDDLVACCGPERERFERELQRMRGYPFRRLVIVGARADIEAGRYRSQIKPRAVLASLSAFEVRYDLPLCYFPDPEAAALQVESWCYWIAREIRHRADNLLKGSPGRY